MILPCKSQTRGWRKSDTLVYEKIKEESDEIIYASEEYTNKCMFLRNRMLVDNSDFCVCYKINRNGGTAYTTAYAQKQNKSITNLAESI